MFTVAITGPESTGKSTLATQLSAYYQAPWVPEYAREYLAQLSRPYGATDLITIAEGQLAQQALLAQQQPELLILDTEMLVLTVWYEHSYGAVNPFILEAWQAQQVDLYLLMDIDLPWQPDPQREHPNLRPYFYEKYRSALAARNLAFAEISGSRDERLQNAVSAIDAARAKLRK